MAPGSVPSRVLERLAVRPATAAGLAAVLGESAHSMGSLLCRMHDVGQVAAYYTVGEARRRGIQIEVGPGKFIQDRAQVFGLPQAAILAKSRENGLMRRGYSGLTHQIRELLADEPGLTWREIAQRLERDMESVRGTLYQLVKPGGGVVRRGSGKNHRFYLFDKSAGRRRVEVDPARPYLLAATITHGRGSVWGAGLA